MRSPAGAEAPRRPRGPLAGALHRALHRAVSELDRRQPVATPRTTGAVTGGLFVVCSLYGGLAAALRHDAPHRPELAVLLTASLVTGCLVLLLQRHLTTRHYHLLYAGGVLLIAVCAHLDRAGSATAGLADATVMVLLAVCALFFFPATTGALHMLVAVVAAATALRGSGVTAADLLVVASTWVLVAVLVGHLSSATRSADTDALTGLANRRGFERAAAALLAAHRGRSPLSLVLLDLDHFKTVNDTLGHEAGDDLLRRTGRSWAPLVPPGGELGRWGGDEFALLVPLDPVATTRLVEALRGALPHDRSSTAGVSGVRPGEGLQTAMRRADEALYAAKRSRRGTTAVWDDVVAQPWLESQPSMRSDSGSSGSSASSRPEEPSSGASSRSMPTAAI